MLRLKKCFWESNSRDIEDYTLSASACQHFVASVEFGQVLIAIAQSPPGK